MLLDGGHQRFFVKLFAARLAGQKRDRASGALAAQLGHQRLGCASRQDSVDHVAIEAVELQGRLELGFGGECGRFESEFRGAGGQTAGAIGTGDPSNVSPRARCPGRIPTASPSGGDSTETLARRTLVRRW